LQKYSKPKRSPLFRYFWIKIDSIQVYNTWTPQANTAGPRDHTFFASVPFVIPSTGIKVTASLSNFQTTSVSNNSLDISVRSGASGSSSIIIVLLIN
jgi:hypothetical protein